MIIVCRKCLPTGTPTHGQPVSFLYATGTCEVCGKSRPRSDLFNVEGTAADIRFSIWTETYRHGAREARR